MEVFKLSQNPPLLYEKEKMPFIFPRKNTTSFEVELSPLRSHHIPLSDPTKKMLIVYTTCNHLPMTILSLQYMRLPSSIVDLLIVDDHSTDGTVEYLRKKGFAVISKPRATGLTDSWNIGYRFAVMMGYPSILFTNNDVLLTAGSLGLIHSSMVHHTMVVPLTTEKGAGHNPAQSISRALRLHENMTPYLEDFTQADSIQAGLARYFARTNKNGSVVCKAVPSRYHSKPKFNGFSFAVNTERIAPAAYKKDKYLFDPGDVIVGQEDHLMSRMKKANLQPMILYCVFLYHFKSVTVSAASSEAVVQKLKDKNVRIESSKTSPIIKLQYQDSKNHTVSKTIDIREDLSWYHPEAQQKQASELQRVGENNTSQQLAVCSGEMPFPQAPLWTPSSLPPSNISFLYKKMSGDVITDSYCIYPTHWSSRCSNLSPLFSKSFSEDDVGAPKSKDGGSVISPVVIAIATSDPIKYPSAGDIFTAYELGQALQARFSNVQIRYLRRGPQWYAVEHLYDVDVLLTLLDEYDLSKIQPLYQTIPKARSGSPGPSVLTCNDSIVNGTLGDPSWFHLKLHLKPSLITIAWMRNWFQRWLMRPWFGQYDLLLTSSVLSKSFFDQISSTVGFSSHCSINCPSMRDRQGVFNRRAVVETLVFPLATSVHEESKANRNKRERSSVQWFRSMFTVRNQGRSTPWVLRNDFANAGDMEHVLNKRELNMSSWTAQLFSGVDYIFTGSYHFSWRDIMSFDPSTIPMWKGRILGNGWSNAPNMSAWAEISIGLLPYEMVKEAYKVVKIVVDDANHVTGPWGSVNSRVFDALAAGALVVSNGAFGIYELFGEALEEADLPMPIYTSGQELAATIDFFLRNENIRLRVVEVMKKVVVEKHSYSIRAEQLAGILKRSFRLDLVPRVESHRATTTDHSLHGESETFSSIPESTSGSKDHDIVHGPDDSALFGNASLQALNGPNSTYSESEETRSSLCVGVRTMPSQMDWLYIFVKSLLVQYQKSVWRSRIDLNILLVDTEANSTFIEPLFQLVDRLNREGGGEKPLVEALASSQTSKYQNPFYGYDFTDRLLKFMLMRYQLHEAVYPNPSTNDGNMPKKSRRSKSASLRVPPCSWIMFTNGDNMYHTTWFDKVAPAMLDKQLEIIGWDFITHHPRGPQNDIPSHHISMELKRGFVDLASVMVRADQYLKRSTVFLPDAMITDDLHARDYFVVKQLAACLPPHSVKIIHQCLLFQH
eukprot:gene4082-4464_t